MMIQCEKIIHSLNVGILIIDEDLTLHFVNKWVGAHADFTPENAIGKNLLSLFELDEDRLKSLKRHIKTALTLKSPSFFTADANHYLLPMKNSITTKSVFEFMQQDITILPYDTVARHVTLLIYDQTSLMEEKMRCDKESQALEKAVKTANATIRKLETAKNKLIKQRDIIYQQAHCDHLTSLANRTVLNQKLQQLIDEGAQSDKKFGILFLDLDNFKEINDTLGHDMGDMILIHVAKTLLLCTRKSDTVTRFGGDEFIILIDNVDNEENLKTIAAKLVETIGQPLKIQNHHLHVTASIGVSIFPKHGSDFNQLIKNADLALYLAKNEGRDTYRIQS